MNNVYAIVNDGFKYKEFTLRITDVMGIVPSGVNPREVMKYNYLSIQMKDWWFGLKANFKNIEGDPSADIPDISEWRGGSLVLSPKAHNCLADILGPYGELLPVDCEGETYYVFNCLMLALIDKKNSEQDVVGGMYRGVKKLIFNPFDVLGKLIFKTKFDRCLGLYCCDEFKEVVEGLGLSGVKFRSKIEDRL